jgi:hypothetical protein
MPLITPVAGSRSESIVELRLRFSKGNTMETNTRRLFITAILIALFAPVITVLAQENPCSNFTRVMYGPMKQMVLQSAEKVPEEHYALKPTEAVRYGQILGHIADSQYIFCSIVVGEKNPMPRVEKTKSTKPTRQSTTATSSRTCASRTSCRPRATRSS